jgi:hypothetical protein
MEFRVLKFFFYSGVVVRSFDSVGAATFLDRFDVRGGGRIWFAAT